MVFPDYRRAPNIAARPDLYEVENRAVDPDGLVLAAMRSLPFQDASVDVVHARFAYFWPPGCQAGLGEVLRMLTPAGSTGGWRLGRV